MHSLKILRESLELLFSHSRYQSKSVSEKSVDSSVHILHSTEMQSILPGIPLNVT
jgi:hypothetical protein